MGDCHCATGRTWAWRQWTLAPARWSTCCGGCAPCTESRMAAAVQQHALLPASIMCQRLPCWLPSVSPTLLVLRSSWAYGQYMATGQRADGAPLLAVYRRTGRCQKGSWACCPTSTSATRGWPLSCCRSFTARCAYVGCSSPVEHMKPIQGHLWHIHAGPPLHRLPCAHVQHARLHCAAVV